MEMERMPGIRITRLLALIVAIPVCMSLAGCGGEIDQEADRQDASRAAATPNKDRRVRVMNTLPKFRLRSQEGVQFGSQELEGKVWIANFIFTRCTQTCPVQTAELVKLQDALRDDPSRDQIHFVSITVDPGHDSPEVLRKYAQESGADPKHWTFLTGTREEIWRLSKDGFTLPVAGPPVGADSIITHSQNFVLVDRARRIRGHYDGLNEQAREELKNDLQIVLEDPPGPITEP
jgi:protein SCO1/2